MYAIAPTRPVAATATQNNAETTFFTKLEGEELTKRVYSDMITTGVFGKGACRAGAREDRTAVSTREPNEPARVSGEAHDRNRFSPSERQTRRGCARCSPQRIHASFRRASRRKVLAGRPHALWGLSIFSDSRRPTRIPTRRIAWPRGFSR